MLEYFWPFSLESLFHSVNSYFLQCFVWWELLSLYWEEMYSLCLSKRRNETNHPNRGNMGCKWWLLKVVPFLLSEELVKVIWLIRYIPLLVIYVHLLLSWYCLLRCMHFFVFSSLFGIPVYFNIREIRNTKPRRLSKLKTSKKTGVKSVRIQWCNSLFPICF